MKRFGEIIKTKEEEFAKEKHMPIIDVPASVKKDEFFEFTVTVGKDVPHPNTIEHHIKWIQVFADIDGRAPIHIGTFDFGPTFSEPKVTLKLKLEKTANIFALEYCNLHGVWENVKKIEVKE